MVEKLYKIALVLLLATSVMITEQVNAAALVNRFSQAVKTAIKKHPAVVTQLRTVACSQPPKIALQPMRGITATRSLSTLSKPASFLHRTEANQGFIRTFIAPLLVGTGSQRTITTDAAIGNIVPIEEGPLARTKLLTGQLAGITPAHRESTLVHGAMLSELGMIKALYTLLVTPKTITLDDGQTRLVPDSSFSPLGTLLQQFFYLAGGTLSPTKRTASCAYRLTPAGLGSLYKAVVDDTLTADFNPQIKYRSGKASKEEYESTRTLLIETLLACNASTQFDTAKLSPIIIRSYFWAKFVTSAETTAQAAANIAAFSEASGNTGLSAGTISQEVELEKNCIQRIADSYGYNLPKPPIQGRASLALGSFPDCVETGIRGIFNALFYNEDSKEFVLPETNQHFYDPQLIAYFKQFSRLTTQSTQEARNAWANLIAHRPEIEYNKPTLKYEAYGNFTNVMGLMAQLVPGIYHTISIKCQCNETCAWKKQPTTPAETLSLPAQIKAHFKASPACAQQMLDKIAQHHGLNIQNFTPERNGHSASWEIHKGHLKKCVLKCKPSRGHFTCELHTVVTKQNDIEDVTLGFANMLGSMPNNPDKTPSLLFAGARMAQQQDYAMAHLALIPEVTKEESSAITNNITGWGLLTPEDQRILSEDLVTDDHKVCQAAEKGFMGTYNHLLDSGRASPNAKNKKKIPLIITMAKKGDLDEVEKLVKKGGHVDSTDSNGSTLLIEAILSNKIKDVKRYLALGANPNALSWKRNDAFVVTAQRRSIELLKLLIDAGTNINATNDTGTNILITAIEEAPISLEIINLALEKNIDVNAKDETGRSALSYAAARGNLALCNQLLNKGASIDGAQAGFISAARNGHLEVVKLFIEQGMPVNGKYRGATAISEATERGQIGIITYLLEKGANPDNALPNRTCASSTTLIKLFLDAGANINATEKNGNTILMIAADEGRVSNYSAISYREEYQSHYLDVINMLLETKININTKNSNGESALSFIAQTGNIDLFRRFIDKGATINGAECGFVHAAGNGSLDIVKQCLELGMPIDAKRWFDQRTALHNAANRNKTDIMQYLLEKGAFVNAINNNGHTPLMNAAWNGDVDAVKMLLACKGVDTSIKDKPRGDDALAIAESFIHHSSSSAEQKLRYEEIRKLLKEHNQRIQVDADFARITAENIKAEYAKMYARASIFERAEYTASSSLSKIKSVLLFWQ